MMANHPVQTTLAWKRRVAAFHQPGPSWQVETPSRNPTLRAKVGMARTTIKTCSLLVLDKGKDSSHCSWRRNTRSKGRKFENSRIFGFCLTSVTPWSRSTGPLNFQYYHEQPSNFAVIHFVPTNINDRLRK